MKRVFVLLMAAFALSAITARAADSTKINGWISDSMCGAKHAGSGNRVRGEMHRDGRWPRSLWTRQKKAVWTIDNPDAVKGFYGDHVTVTAIDGCGQEERSHRLDRRGQVESKAF